MFVNLLVRKFNQTRHGEDIELREVERQEQIKRDVANLSKFSYNPRKVQRVRVSH